MKYQSHAVGKYAWQRAMHTDLDFFHWVKQYPENLKLFQQMMTVGEWLDVVPFAKAAASVEPDSVLFVDVGGSIGHQCARLKTKYRNLPGRIIVQELEENIKAAPQLEGVEFMIHDFFTPQPVSGMFSL